MHPDIQVRKFPKADYEAVLRYLGITNDLAG
jgi:hypothetical protein